VPNALLRKTFAAFFDVIRPQRKGRRLKAETTGIFIGYPYFAVVTHHKLRFFNEWVDRCFVIEILAIYSVQ